MTTFSRTRQGVVGSVAAVVLVATAGAAAAAPGGTSLQRDVEAIHATGAVGVQAEVSTPGGAVEARAGVADLRTGRPIARGAHFRGGSNTKTYVATTVLQLVAEKRISLDDTVDTWLPGLVHGKGNDGTKITVRQLLQHTSGLYDYSNDLDIYTEEGFEKHRFDHYAPEHLVRMALRHRPDFQPGDRNPDGTLKWKYSNTGYVLAGMIIKRVTGEPWEREVQRRIVRPLGLTRTVFAQGREFPRPRTRGYNQFTAGGPLKDVTDFDHSWASSAGSLITTTGDHNRFFKALLGGRLLPPAQLAEMRKTVPMHADGSLTGAGYGLGLMRIPLSCSKAGYWAHGGDTLGYATREGVTPDARRSIAISVSTQVDAPERQEAALAKTVQNALCGR